MEKRIPMDSCYCCERNTLVSIPLCFDCYCKNKKLLLLLELDAIFKECQSKGWDGCGASPMTAETVAIGKLFLTALPLNLLPSSDCISADPDGEIGIEWYKSSKRHVTISIGERKLISYAYTFGDDSWAAGTEPFGGNIPEHIVGLIRKVVGG